MSYAAEPYLHVTDQVLTALTGGVAREEQRFFARANSFSFGLDADRVLPDTVRVIGQVNQTAFAFQQGRDFLLGRDGLLRFKADAADATQPAAGASWPDEGSEFYVSYYHSESGKALLTDRNVGSLTRTLGEAFARELTVLRKQLELVYESAFIDTAEGSSLDMVVALLGLSRKNREFAAGSVRFFRDSAAPADIYIPEGTRVSTALSPAVSFVTSVAKTLRRGQLSVEADIRAETRGAAGVVAAQIIKVVNQPILGIAGVMNDAPTVFGGSAESDAELRARAKKVMERAGKATPRAMVNALTEVGGLRENEIKLVEELQLRPGVVQVFVARDPSMALAAEVQEAVLNSRAAGIRVEHSLQVALPSPPQDTLLIWDARDEGVSDELPDGDSFELPLLCDVMVFPENPRLGGAEQETLRQAVIRSVVAYVEASAIGGVLVYNRMVADLMAVPGVLDVNLELSVAGDASGKRKRNIDMQDGKRAGLLEKDVQVSFAGAPVNFDFNLRATAKGAATREDMRKEAKARLVDYFAGLSGKVDHAELIGKFAGCASFTLLPADLTWSVEYDQAGLTIREQGGATTAIAPGDRALLRDVKVEVQP